jgi:putative transposase
VTQRGNRRERIFFEEGGSVAMDEDHLMIAARYVALNPVRARLAPTARMSHCQSEAPGFL